MACGGLSVGLLKNLIKNTIVNRQRKNSITLKQPEEASYEPMELAA